MYDPKIARFLQEDTYRGNAADPLSLNLYTYCHNEPVMYYDPTGHIDEAAGNAYIQRNYSDLWKDLSGYGAKWNEYNKKLQEIEQKLKKDPKNQSLKDKYNTALSDRNYWHILADSLRADLEKRDPVYYNTRHGIPLTDYNKSGKNGGQGNNKSTTDTGKSNSGNPTPPQNGTNPFVEFFKGFFAMNDAGKALVDDFNRRMMEVNAQDFWAIRNKYLSNEYMHGVDITSPEVQKEADKVALAMLMMGPSSNMEMMTNMLSSQATALMVQRWGQQYTDFFEGLDNVDVYKTIMNNNDPNKGAIKLWSVDPAMQAADIEAGVLKDGAYIKNPTAQNINDLVKNGSNYIGNSKFNGQFMYVVDRQGNIIIGNRAGQRMPHPTLIGGVNPQVRSAGIVEIRGGKIYKVDNASGHFKPGEGALDASRGAFSKLPSNVFAKDFKGYVPYSK